MFSIIVLQSSSTRDFEDACHFLLRALYCTTSTHVSYTVFSLGVPLRLIDLFTKAKKRSLRVDYLRSLNSFATIFGGISDDLKPFRAIR